MDTPCKRLAFLFVGLCCVIAILSGVVLGSTFGLLHTYVSSIEWAMPIAQANALKNHEKSPSLAQDTKTLVNSATAETVSVTPVYSTAATLTKTTSVGERQKKYTSHTVQPHEMLSKLDPIGWQHTCKVNQQLGRIKNDCRLVAYATILLPVAVVARLESNERMVAQHPPGGNAPVESCDRSCDSPMRIARAQQ